MVSHNAIFNFWLISQSGKESKKSTIDHEFDSSAKVYDITNYNRRQVFVMIEKYNVSKPPTFKFDSSLQK